MNVLQILIVFALTWFSGTWKMQIVANSTNQLLRKDVKKRVLSSAYYYRPGTRLSASQKKDFISSMNRFRGTPAVPAANMNKVTYNYKLEKAILDYVASKAAEVNISWFQAYEAAFYDKTTGCKQPPGFGNSKSFYCLLNQPQFAEFRNQGCHGVVLDSCEAGKWVKAIQFRLSKAFCFNYDGCSQTTFTGYETCNYTRDIKESTKPCTDFWMYQAQFYRWDYSNFTLIPTWYVPPPLVTGDQNSGYVMFGCATEGNEYPSNDRPYQRGASGSDCSAGRKRSGTLCALKT